MDILKLLFIEIKMIRNRISEQEAIEIVASEIGKMGWPNSQPVSVQRNPFFFRDHDKT